MPENSPALEIRIARLERASKIMVIACVLLAAAAVAAFVYSQLQVVDPVRVRRIELVDEEGRLRIELKHDSTETGLFIRDAAGDIRVGAAQFAHGGGGFALHGPEAEGAVVLYLKGDGSLTFFDAAGTITYAIPERR